MIPKEPGRPVIIAFIRDPESLKYLEINTDLILTEGKTSSGSGQEPVAIVACAEDFERAVKIRCSIFPRLPVVYCGSADEAPPEADDVLETPLSTHGMKIFLRRLHYLKGVLDDSAHTGESGHKGEIYKLIIGESPEMTGLFKSMERVMDFDINVLIMGESGTGKELIARAVHDGSSRRDGPFVAINCAGIAPDIADSLLFGHSRGAFTGAHSEHAGFFEQADHGTIFLDEIGELHQEVQSKLLRVLEDRKVRAVGSRSEKPIDFRVLSATNRDLRDEIGEGRFRKDLYYRLEEYTLKVPPLRERKGDIPLLARHFLREFCSFYDLGDMSFSPVAMDILESMPWSGNVRELRHYVQKLALQTIDPVITEIEIIDDVQHQAGKALTCAETENIMPLEELERREIEKAFVRYEGQIERIAVALGISRATLYRKLKLYGII